MIYLYITVLLLAGINCMPQQPQQYTAPGPQRYPNDQNNNNGGYQQYGGNGSYPQNGQYNNGMYDNGSNSNSQNGQQRYGSSGQFQQNSGQGSVSTYQETQFSDHSNSSAKLQQYSFNNGQCYYENNSVVENGQRRQLTQDEVDRLAQFERNMADYSKQISASLGDWVKSLLQWDPVDNHESSFPNFSPFPTMPTVPCFCTSCNQTQS